MIAGSRSFAAIGQWAADAGEDVLAVLGAGRGPAEESTFRRPFALLDSGRLDHVLGAWLWNARGEPPQQGLCPSCEDLVSTTEPEETRQARTPQRRDSWPSFARQIT